MPRERRDSSVFPALQRGNPSLECVINRLNFFEALPLSAVVNWPVLTNVSTITGAQDVPPLRDASKAGGTAAPWVGVVAAAGAAAALIGSAGPE